MRFVNSIDEMSPADLSMSLDVSYHITDYNGWERHLNDLFSLSLKYVLIYSVNSERKTVVRHMKHRMFSEWIAANINGSVLLDKAFYPGKENGIGFYLFGKDR